MTQTLKYGLTWQPNGHSGASLDANIELQMIKAGGYVHRHGQTHGHGLAHHVYEFQKLAWPFKYWHRWNKDLILPEVCKKGRLALWGPSSTGKSFEPCFFMLTMFYAHPHGTTGIVSSTTLPALERRIWGYIVEFHKKAKALFPWLPGHMIESKHMLLADPKTTEGRSFKNGIMGVACKKGNQWQSLADFIGTKNDVLLVAADELQFLPQGFLDGMANLESNDSTYIFGMGNLNDTTTALGKLAEPAVGWDAIPDSTKSRVYQTKWDEGRAIQLIGADSPNLDHPEGQEPFKRLIGRRYIDKATKNYGKDTPLYHMFVSGMIPRGTMERRVITRAMCQKFHAGDYAVWGSDKPKLLYGFDAAYSSIGGDRSVGGAFQFGRDVTGNWRLELLRGELHLYTGSDKKETSHEDHLAKTLRGHCERLGIPPGHVFYDGTGRSSFTSSLMRLFSTDCVAVEFGGSASDRPNFQGLRFMDGKDEGELKPCNKVFGKFVTELWFATNALLQADQARGLTEELIGEGVMRVWKEIPGGKQDVEPKDETRTRLGCSPDIYDMFVTAVEGARRLGFPLGKLIPPSRKAEPGMGWLKKMSTEFKEKQREKELAYG